MKRIFGRNELTSSFITVVSGLPRSGTSMMMNMLQNGGYPILVDHERQPDANNPLGYFEYEPVKQLKIGNNNWLKRASGQAVKIVSPLLRYLPEDYKYRVLFIQRKEAEVIASQNEMISNELGEQNDLTYDELLDIYSRHLESVMKWMQAQENLEYLELNYNGILEKPNYHIDRIEYFLDYKLNKSAMSQVIDPTLHRHRKE